MTVVAVVVVIYAAAVSVADKRKKKSQQNRKISPRESSKRLVNSYAGCALGKWVEAMMSPNPDVCVSWPKSN
jgi:heme A synthase